MSRENKAGLGVLNTYGPRPVPDMARGTLKTEGAYNEFVLEFTGKDLNDNLANVLTTLPAGIRFVDWFVEVEEVFALTGTSPTVLVGTDTTEVTNGFVISKAILEAKAVSAISTTFAGTWAATLAADTKVGIAFGGTLPVVANTGKGRIVARYLKV